LSQEIKRDRNIQTIEMYQIIRPAQLPLPTSRQWRPLSISFANESTQVTKPIGRIDPILQTSGNEIATRAELAISSTKFQIQIWE